MGGNKGYLEELTRPELRMFNYQTSVFDGQLPIGKGSSKNSGILPFFLPNQNVSNRVPFWEQYALTKWIGKALLFFLTPIYAFFSWILVSIANQTSSLKRSFSNRNIMSAISSGNSKLALELLKAGAPHSTVDRNGNTMIHLAAQTADHELLKALYIRGPNCNVKNNAGHTPLHTAVLAGHLETAKMLLNYKVDVDALNLKGQTPLHLSALTGNREMADLLLQHSANHLIQDGKGNTPLVAAHLAGKGAFVLHLLTVKSTQNIQKPLFPATIEAKHYLEVALRERKVEASFELLLSKQIPTALQKYYIQRLFILCLEEGKIAYAKNLLNTKSGRNGWLLKILMPISHQPSREESLLCYCCRHQLVQSIAFLLDEGMTPDEGQVDLPIEIAVEQDHKELFQTFASRSTRIPYHSLFSRVRSDAMFHTIWKSFEVVPFEKLFDELIIHVLSQVLVETFPSDCTVFKMKQILSFLYEDRSSQDREHYLPYIKYITRSIDYNLNAKQKLFTENLKIQIQSKNQELPEILKNEIVKWIERTSSAENEPQEISNFTNSLKALLKSTISVSSSSRKKIFYSLFLGHHNFAIVNQAVQQGLSSSLSHLLRFQNIREWVDIGLKPLKRAVEHGQTACIEQLLPSRNTHLLNALNPLLVLAIEKKDSKTATTLIRHGIGLSRNDPLLMTSNLITAIEVELDEIAMNILDRCKLEHLLTPGFRTTPALLALKLNNKTVFDQIMTRAGLSYVGKMGKEQNPDSLYDFLLQNPQLLFPPMTEKQKELFFALVGETPPLSLWTTFQEKNKTLRTTELRELFKNQYIEHYSGPFHDAWHQFQINQPK